MKQLIPSLNGLRAVSIFFVLFAHALLMNFNFKENPGGQVGVSIFFIISGYLITLLLVKEEGTRGDISLKRFYVRRTLRIFPIYYFLLLIYYILQLNGYLLFSLNSWLTSITYTKYFSIPQKGDWETGHLWSLSVEEHFYLVWPLVFKYLKKIRVAFAFAIIAIVTFTRLTTDISVMHLFTRADALMWGCLFALYNNKLMEYINKRKAIFSILPFVTLLIVLAFKRIITLLGYSNYEAFATTFFGSYGLVTNISIGFIILVSISFKNTYWYKILNSTPFDYFGRISYSIYLWQQLFFSPNIQGISKFPNNIIIILIVANLSYYLIERPFLSLKGRLVKGKVSYSNGAAILK